MTAARTVVARWTCERHADSSPPALLDGAAAAFDATVGNEDALPSEACV